MLWKVTKHKSEVISVTGYWKPSKGLNELQLETPLTKNKTKQNTTTKNNKNNKYPNNKTEPKQNKAKQSNLHSFLSWADLLSNLHKANPNVRVEGRDRGLTGRP